MASPARFERATFRLGGGCSIQLSYGDIYSFYKRINEEGGSPTFRLGGGCSIQLSYGDMLHFDILSNLPGTVKLWE